MRSNNALAVPTLGSPELLGSLVESINHQTYDEFDFVIVVSKKGDIKSLKSYLFDISTKNIEFIIQKEEGIIDAMNTVFSLNYKNVILTDDDAMPLPDYVYNSLNSLDINSDTGCVFGRVNGKFPDSTFNKISRFLNSYCSVKSLLKGKANRYFNLAGLPVGNVLPYPVKKNVIDYFPIGVSMSWKQSEIRGLNIPLYSRRGILFETYLSMIFYLRGLNTMFVKNISVKHLEKESLSRGSSSIYKRISDIYTFPLMLNKLGFEIDTNKLRRILPLLGRFKVDGQKLRKSVEETILEIEKNGQR